MRTMTRRVALSMLAAFGALAATNAIAQSYPDRPVRLVVPYAPGGIVDYVGRTLAQRLNDTLGQPVVAIGRILLSLVSGNAPAMLLNAN